MSEKKKGELPRIGVYVFYSPFDIANLVDEERVADFSRGLPGVVVSKVHEYTPDNTGLDMVRADIKEHNLEKVVVASCSPKVTGTMFAGMPGIEHVDIAYASWVHADDPIAATEHAKNLVRAAVRKVASPKAWEPKKIKVNPNVLVVGGGIAGIHASLVIADSGKKVYLVEREPSIGGHMAKFDKTFPTLDCAACILTPKMAQVGSHPNIELYTYSELKSIEGYVGNFKAKILKKSRRIIEDKCTACGECTKVCPVEVPSAYEEGLTMRKAAYRPFPQAVPNKYLIERLGYPPCQAACPIHQNAFGYITLVKEGKFKEALDVVLRDNPLPSICGRVCHHPCTDACTRGKKDEHLHIPGIKRFITDYAGDFKLPMPEDLKERKEKVAIIGSGPAGLTAAYELRKRGYQVTIFEKLPAPGGMMRKGIPVYRLPVDVLDRDIQRILDTGVELRLNTLVGRDISFADLRKEYDAVFISVGADKNRELGILAEDTPGVWSGLDFLWRIKRGDEVHLGKKVVVIGGGLVAVDAARTALYAARAAVRLGAEVTLICIESWDEMVARKSEEGRIEVDQAVAEGVQIMTRWGPKGFRTKGGKLRGVELKAVLRVFDDEGRFAPQYDETKTRIKECDTVIVAIGQVPDLDPFLKDGLAVSRWGTVTTDPVTLETNLPGVFAGGDCVTGPDVIVTAMMAGKKAAESIHRYINKLDMYKGREYEGSFQGVVRDIDMDKVSWAPQVLMPTLESGIRTTGYEEVRKGYTPEQAQEEAARCLSCSICCDCHLCQSACPAECIDYTIPDEMVDLDVGAVIVATGFKAFDARRIPSYGYGKYPNVFTSLEVERLLNSSGPTEGKLLTRDGRVPEAVGIVHCVGSRDKNYNEYCSAVCCMYSLKFAHLVHERTGADVYNCYIDMRTAGKGYEEFYLRLLDEGTNFIRGRVAEITDWAITPEERGKLIMIVEDTTAESTPGSLRRIPVDMVILSVGLEPQPDTQTLRRILNITTSKDGFFQERHPKLSPVSTFTPGIFVAGACQGPKDIPETIAQAGAAAGEVLALLDKGYIELKPRVNEELCTGSQMCVEACPYGAIKYNHERKVSQINEALCEACGTCVVVCPSGAIQ